MLPSGNDAALSLCDHFSEIILKNNNNKSIVNY